MHSPNFHFLKVGHPTGLPGNSPARAALKALHRASFEGDHTDLEILKVAHRSTTSATMDEQALRFNYEVQGRLSCRVIPRFGFDRGETLMRCRNCDTHKEPCKNCAGKKIKKLRCCGDDAHSSGVNAHARMNEAAFYPSFEFSARVGAEIDTG